MIYERRFSPSRWQARGSDLSQSGVTLYGYAALFGVLSQEMPGGFREKIAPGAFKRTIRDEDIRCLWNHDSNFVLARNRSGTLKLWEDKRGLAFEAIPPDTQFARDLVTSIKRGDITQNSFGFVIRDESLERKNDQKIRILKDVKLFDISPVTFAAYTETEISVKGKWGETIIRDRKFLERFDAMFFDEERLAFRRK